MKRQPITAGNDVSSADHLIVAKIKVHNAAGECSVALTPDGESFFSTAPDGHYMLDAKGMNRTQGDDEMAIASVSVKSGDFEFYLERLVPELGVGQHDLVATSHVVLATSPRPKGPR